MQDCLLCCAESGRDLVCGACAADLPDLPEHCPQCAMPSPGSAVCGGCLQHPPSFDLTLALWRYEFPCDRLVQALKYHSRLALAGFFARALLHRRRPSADLIIPMPLHLKRLAGRGFNQAVEIARVLARSSAIALALGAVRRIRHTAPQTELPYDARAKNVRGAFACALDLTDSSVIVIDDVMTTGATLNEFAATLKRAGAARVESWVVARTLPR